MHALDEEIERDQENREQKERERNTGAAEERARV